MTEVGSQYQAKICVAKTFVNDRVFLIEGGAQRRSQCEAREDEHTGGASL